MKNIKLFERELNLIKNEELRKITTDFMNECVPSYFWEIGASSTGKYHPKFAQGVGGLVRHTKAVVMFAEELLKMSSYSYLKDDYKDYIIVACIVHDTCKYGVSEFDKTQFEHHGKLASVEFHRFCIDYDYSPSELLLNAIKSHMGQWTPEKEDRPFTSLDRCVHMADYMASRSFIDIPSIIEEYEKIMNVDNN